MKACALFAICFFVSRAPAAIVKDGQPSAEIIISATPQRSVRVAAQDLQDCIVKISGAKLPILTAPSGTATKIFVGQSSFTDALKLTPVTMKNGAYRMVSGEDWLALLGDDTDFVPTEPWAKNNGGIASGWLQAEWDKITGAKWGVPNGGMYKNRIKLPGTTGKPEGAPTEKNEWLELWGFDERGSFNAVSAFLRGLGMRWYLPGELGEVVPSLKDIPLPKVDQTVLPDFPVRRFNVRFGTNGHDTSMWMMHLGVRDPNGLQVAHGMDRMTHRDELFDEHPDWFALYGGKRQTQKGERLNQLCYSNEELFQETVKYARAQFDHYDFESVSIMPPDGYTSICQCGLCKGKDDPSRADRGHLSDYVWDFVNRVAKEVGKTHPNKKILCCAYGSYTLPPLKIEKLEPNVLVCIVGGRRPVNKAGTKGSGESEPGALRAAWVKKTDNPILIFENYPFTDRGWYLPSFVPHALGESVNATKGVSQGEDIWLSMGRDFDTVGIGYNHFPVYFTARMYWGGKEADVDAMFREYCRLFYGPAESEMHGFFSYCEANWSAMEDDKAIADEALHLFATAQQKAGAETVYGKRMALIDDYLKGLRNKARQLGKKRGPVPSLRLVGDAQNIVIDGKLDDEYWQECPVAATGKLRELQTGRQPIFGTSIKAGWQGNNLYFAIKCDEHPGDKPNNTSTKEDDSALWYGDVVEVLLETESHSYYQIAISPSGVITDMDRAAGKAAGFAWDSQAEVATHIAEDHWTVEIRIPVTTDENDPLHQVIGRHPIPSLPWHFNVCRQRIRENGSEASAFSPTGVGNFHNVMKFAHFFDGKSTQFDAAEPDDDYLTGARKANDLARQRKHEEALAAFTQLAETKITDVQKSDALEQAAASARVLKNDDAANDIAARIPIEAVKKTVQMQNLLAQRKTKEVIEQFKAEDISAWPFWKAGDGYAARGRAYAALEAGKEAEEDLAHALEFTSDPRARESVQLALGNNRERTLKDDEAALNAYRSIFEPLTSIGGADQFSAVQAAARVLTRQGKFDEAIATLHRIDTEKLRGTWRHSTLIALGDTLRAAGKKTEAIAAYQKVLTDTDAEPRHRQAAEAALKLP